MGNLYQRGRHWYGDWIDAQGERQRKSLKTTDKAVARQRLRSAELATGDRASNQGLGLVAALDYALAEATNPNTHHSYSQKARHLVRLLGDGDVNNLTRDTLVQYVATRTVAEGAHKNTVHKELVVLRLALKQAAHRRLLHLDIGTTIPRIKNPYKARTRWLTQDEFAALLRELQPHRQLWVALSVYTSANLSEVERIAPGDISSTHVHIRGTKREKRDRRVPIAPPLKPWLEGVALPVQPWPNSRRDLAAACKRATVGTGKKKRKGMPPVTSNDLRRTFCSWLIQEGADLLSVAKMMGHTSTRMVEQVYAQLRDEDLVRAIEKMPAPLPRAL